MADTLNVDVGGDRRQALLQRVMDQSNANTAAANQMDTLNRQNARRLNLPYAPNAGRGIAPSPAPGPVQNAIFPGLPVTGTSPYAQRPPMQQVILQQAAPVPPASGGPIDDITRALLIARQQQYANGPAGVI